MLIVVMGTVEVSLHRAHGYVPDQLSLFLESQIKVNSLAYVLLVFAIDASREFHSERSLSLTDSELTIWT